MNKFVQVLVALCCLIWLIIGIGVIVGGVSLIGFLSRGGLSAVLPFVTPQGGQGAFGGATGSQSIEQKISNPEAQACAARILGERRIAEIAASGELPSPSELVRLTPCLK